MNINFVICIMIMHYNYSREIELECVTVYAMCLSSVVYNNASYTVCLVEFHKFIESAKELSERKLSKREKEHTVYWKHHIKLAFGK